MTETKPKAPAEISDSLHGGSETILVVEDETAVREFVVEVLGEHGYRTLVADSGPAALQRWQEHDGKIDLLLTDMVMPGGLNGYQLSERLLTQDPALKVLYSSGYSPGLNDKELTALQGKAFLPKPYRANELLEKLRDCLDEVPVN
jgi:CheY-like chemotaxis protein